MFIALPDKFEAMIIFCWFFLFGLFIDSSKFPTTSFIDFFENSILSFVEFFDQKDSSDWVRASNPEHPAKYFGIEEIRQVSAITKFGFIEG